MNKSEYVFFTQTISEFRKDQQDYKDFLEAKKNAGTELTPTQLVEMKETSKKRKEGLEKLKTKMMKLDRFLHPEKYKQLMSSIENELALASMLEEDCTKYIETQDAKYFDSILSGMVEEEEYGPKLVQSLMMVENQFGILILGSALGEKMSLEELRDLAVDLPEDTMLKRNMEELIGHLEQKEERKEKKEETPVEETKEQEEEKKEQVEQASIPATSAGAATEEKELTFEQKLAAINFKEAGNITAEVQELTVEERLAQVDRLLEKYNDKEKLSLRDMIEVQSLTEERTLLEAYQESLSDPNLTRSERRRDKKMSVTEEQIKTSLDSLQQSRENYQQYQSKVMRFFSMRYQEQLQVNIQKLREKRGVLQHEQKLSAIAKFNKQSGRMIRSSRIKGITRGTRGYAATKIAELQALKEQVQKEFSALKQDMGRFQSRREEVPSLQGQTIVAPDRIISLEEYRRTKEQTLAA